MPAIYIKISETMDVGPTPIYYMLRINLGNVSLRSRNDTHLDLSWLSDDAAAFRYALIECERTPEALVEVVAKYAGNNGMRSIEHWVP